MLLYIIQTIAADLTAEPGDFPQISAEQRHAETKRLNDLALLAYPWARCDSVLSPGVMLWLSPFLDLPEAVPAPRLFPHTTLGLTGLLHDAVPQHADIRHH